jgi:predicted dehydrogenase
MAAALADALDADPEASIVAVGSANSERARSFAKARGIPRWYASHDAVATDPEVDVVYVATTNDRHHHDVLNAVAAGKAVLNEKPFAMNATEAEAMVAAARSAGVFCMEAMWMRFQPFLARLEELVAAGVIGEPRHLSADFGFPIGGASDRRWLSPALGGGSLLDMGVYPLTLAITLFGPPEDLGAVSDTAATGVDAQTAFVTEHAGGALASLSSSFTADTTLEAALSGPEGRIRLHRPFHHAPVLTVERHGDVVDRFEFPNDGSGHGRQITEVHRCLDAGLTESPRMPLDDTLVVMGALDALRAEIGLTYPSA